jgi:hypothetical protein
MVVETRRHSESPGVIVTICSGLYLLIGMPRFSSKWILSHSTWYKSRRSGHGRRGSMRIYVNPEACIRWQDGSFCHPHFLSKHASAVESPIPHEPRDDE